jgi:tetratricopeptide (TPR) repeat protein
MFTKASLAFVSVVGLLSGQSAWDSHTRQGVILDKEGRYADAAREFNAAVEVADAAQLPGTLDSLGVLYRQLGRYPEAEKCHRRAIALLEGTGRSLELATALENLGGLRLVENRPSQAQVLYGRALELRGGVRVGETLHGLAQAAHAQRHYAEAEDYYRRASAILGGGALADALHNWGTLYCETGRDELGRPLLERAAAVYEKSRPQHPKLAIILRNLAELEAKAGHSARAQELFERAVQICEASLPADHPQTGVILQAYGRFLKNAHRKTEAKVVNERASAILAKGMVANGSGDTVDVSEFRRR